MVPILGTVHLANKPFVWLFSETKAWQSINTVTLVSLIIFQSKNQYSNLQLCKDIFLLCFVSSSACISYWMSFSFCDLYCKTAPNSFHSRLATERSHSLYQVDVTKDCAWYSLKILLCCIATPYCYQQRITVNCTIVKDDL